MAKLVQYQIEEVFGESTLLAKNKDGVRKVLKYWRCPGKNVDSVVKEVLNFARKIEHSYLVGIEDVFGAADAVYLVTQYCEGGSLHALIKRARQYEDTINEVEVVEWVIQITLGLHHLHAGGIAYGQLSPKNVLLSDHCCHLSTANLIFRQFNSIASQQSPVVTPYTSPELLPEPDASTGSGDIWALGCIMYELCAQKKLFPKTTTHEDLASRISRRSLATFPEIYRKEISEIWFRMMDRDPANRLSLDELLLDSYVSSICKEFEDERKVKKLCLNHSNASSTMSREDFSQRCQPSDRAVKFDEYNREDSGEYDENDFLTADDLDYLLNPADD